MSWKQMLLSGALVFGLGSVWAEEPAPNPAPNQGNGAAPEAKDGKGDGNREGRGDRGRGRGNRGGGEERGGPGMGRGGPGGPGNNPAFGRFQQQFGPEQFATTAARAAGVELEDTKTEAKIDTLPFGSQRRFVTLVPVGGIDSFSSLSEPWKLEQMYKLTFEQSNSLQTIRDEYKAELKKLQDEMTAQQKAMAEKVKELRAKYELRANDVLTGADKENKQKIDTITSETHTNNAKVAGELLHANKDNKDMNRMWQIGRELREKVSPSIDEAQKKIAELVSPEGKALIEESMKKQADAREQVQRWMDRNRGGEGRERQNPGGGDPVKPPKPPENGNF
ncbi:MAG TPA: hypothetical protein VEJ63_23080 [Planctomycetota bacterium]|nr:hypothetical protein [Planctomycetota bacterium]